MSANIAQSQASLWKRFRSNPRNSVLAIIVGSYFILIVLVGVLLTMAFQQSPVVNDFARGQGVVIYYFAVAAEFLIISVVAPMLITPMHPPESRAQLQTDTPISPLATIVLMLAVTFIIILASLPMQIAALLSEAIQVANILLTSLCIVATAIGYTSISIFVGELRRNKGGALAFSYLAVFLYSIVWPVLVGVVLPGILWFALQDIIDETGPNLIFNYIVAILDSMTPLTAWLFTDLALRNNGYDSIFIIQRVLPDGTSISMIFPWVIYYLWTGILSGVLITLSFNKRRRTSLR